MTDNRSELSVLGVITANARELVDKPEKVLVDQASSETGTVFRLRVDPTDVGKIIGKEGRTARSIRTFLGAISVKLKHRSAMEILEDRDQDTEGNDA